MNFERGINMKTRSLETYHFQADIDVYSKTIRRDDTPTAIITASLKEIKGAYNEFMQDLLLESQEAY